jgi:hypothetical protein
MRNDEKPLLVGPGAIIAASLCAQLCARALAEWPSSSLLWYLNLQVFRPLRYGIDLLPGGDGLAQSTWIAAPLIALIGIGLLLNSRLPLAIAAHLGVIYSALILYCSGITSAPASTLAVAAGPQVWADPNLLATAILLLSLMSAVISHRQYWREIFA